MKILCPFQVFSLTLKNRFVMPAMGTGFAQRDGTITDKLVDYYRTRARGGVGLIVLEEAAVHPLGLGYGYELRTYGDKCLDGLRELAKAIHSEGTKVFMQLAHAGRQTLASVIKDQPVAPSPLPCLKFGQMPRELTIPDIKEVEEAFVVGAVKARDLGYDGVELHAAHGYLLCEFLSPLSNKRRDQYGGNTRNRSRLLVDIITRIHKAVGPHFPVFVKISADEYYEGGLTIEESLKIGGIIEDAGAWALTVSAGNYGSFDWVVQPATKEPGCLVHLAEAFKSKLGIPIMAVGRINDPALAEKILREKKTDLIAMGRALIADPYLPEKTAHGRMDKINKCVADNACIKKLFERGKEIVCTVNKELGCKGEKACEEKIRFPR